MALAFTVMKLFSQKMSHNRVCGSEMSYSHSSTTNTSREDKELQTHPTKCAVRRAHRKKKNLSSNYSEIDVLDQKPTEEQASHGRSVGLLIAHLRPFDTTQPGRLSLEQSLEDAMFHQGSQVSLL